MSEEELHLLVARETGKESLRLLNKNEIKLIVTVLASMKASVNGKKTYGKTGNKATTNQRRKILKLIQELGWEDNPDRINGFVWRMFKINRLEWVNADQCSQLIEALKKMIERKKEKEKYEHDGDTECNSVKKVK